MEQPSAARMYDYYLGGSHNFASDRELARQVLDRMPKGRVMAQENRAFLRRSVRFMVQAGITQFLDIGSGIPTVGSVHETAQHLAPAARTVYVDLDPVAVAHGNLILDGNDQARMVQADLRRPETVLDAPPVRDLLDFDRPIGVLMVAVLHFVPNDADPAGIVRRFHAAVPSGSHLALAQFTYDRQGSGAREAVALYQRTQTPGTARTRAEVQALFDGWDLVEPGVVWLPEWRPDWTDGSADPEPSWAGNYCGVGRKP